ncbi:MAG: hypothetical protein UGF45_12800 [Massilioclostridium sp.]|nr:hypothetical protein [Massilioclostridium sp.]
MSRSTASSFPGSAQWDGGSLAFQLGPAQIEMMYYDLRVRRAWLLTFCCKSQDKQDGFDVLCALKNGLESIQAASSLPGKAPGQGTQSTMGNRTDIL